MARLRLPGSLAARIAVGALAVVASAAAAAPLLFSKDLATPFRHREAPWARSGTCESCHPDHFASWHRTFHRTMTQEATPSSVQGAFDGQVVRYFGISARPYQKDGQFFIDYLTTEGGVSKTLHVTRTVGSHRYQQYLADNPGDGCDNYYRIPLVWHIGEKRWIHLNGAFLSDDSKNYNAYLALWNQNCIFCHNTSPRPGSLNYDELQARARRGERVSWEFDGKYESKVAELGISCESCHGPGGEHTARNRNPLRRYLLHVTGRADPTIVNPDRLDKERSVDVCGQCHGQRLANPPGSIRDWMHTGPVYRAGEKLTDSVTPMHAETPGPPWNPGLVKKRFWGDGTPRLSAYEYQGIRMSACYEKGALTCTSCHTMHGGDVAGQIEPAMRTNEACRSCHARIVSDVAAHTHHDPAGSGSSCYECHMPRAVYGILAIHRSHHIENPDPARDAESGRPNACTNCHLDRSAAWAAEATRKWWGEKYRLPGGRADGGPLEAPSLVSELLGRDPVPRAVAARMAGRRDSPLNVEARAAFVVPLLLEALRDDYPTIRFLARQSLIDVATEAGAAPLVESARAFDYIADPPARTAALATIESRWTDFTREGGRALPPPPAGTFVGPDHQLDRDAAASVVALRLTASKEIDVGE
ncbi:MAG: hypothetical protein IPK07_15800 [Deltaproteobacteria bacterium]|nr:hypothetical protein [Deltaproteobacteria bacterium]